MKKILQLLPLTLLGMLVACTETPRVSESSSSTSLSSSISENLDSSNLSESISSSSTEDVYRVILPNDKGFEFILSEKQPRPETKVTLIVKNLNADSRRLDALLLNGTSLVEKNTNEKNTTIFEFIMPKDTNAVITIEVVDVYAVMVSSIVSSYLSLSGIGNGLFAEGETVNFVPTSFAGYWYKDIQVLNSDVELMRDGNMYSFVMPASLVTITATTGENVYMIHTEENPNYELSLMKDAVAAFGSVVSFRVNLINPDLSITNVIVDEDILEEVDGVYSFVMPSYPVTISVNYEVIYKKISVIPSEHFDASLLTLIDGENVLVSDNNVLTNQKVIVNINERVPGETGFALKGIRVLCGNSLETVTESDISIETEELNTFSFMTIADALYYQIIVEETAEISFPIGSFSGLAPQLDPVEDVSVVTIDNEGQYIYTKGSISFNGILNSNNGIFSVEADYGGFMTYYYDYYFNDDMTIAVEYYKGSKTSWGETGSYRDSALRIYAKEELYTSNGYGIIFKDSTMTYLFQYLQLTLSNGEIVQCLFDYETLELIWDVTCSVIEGSDGTSIGDVVSIQKDGISLVKGRVESSKNVQHQAVIQE